MIKLLFSPTFRSIPNTACTSHGASAFVDLPFFFSFRLIFGLDNGLVVVDYLIQSILMNMATADLYGNMDPFQRTVLSPKRRGHSNDFNHDESSTSDHQVTRRSFRSDSFPPPPLATEQSSARWNCLSLSLYIHLYSPSSNNRRLPLMHRQLKQARLQLSLPSLTWNNQQERRAPNHRMPLKLRPLKPRRRRFSVRDPLIPSLLLYRQQTRILAELEEDRLTTTKQQQARQRSPKHSVRCASACRAPPTRINTKVSSIR